MKTFFVSYTQCDLEWAEWVSWELENNNYEVILQKWDFKPGSNFILEMHQAADNCDSTIIILSEEYLQKEYTAPEWAAAFAKDPKGVNKSLIPIRISNVKPDGLLAQVVYIDLYKAKTEQEAISSLISGVNSKRIKPNNAPPCPIRDKPVFPNGEEKHDVSLLSNRFVFQKITDSQFLNLASIDYPYGVEHDPTEFFDTPEDLVVNCVLCVPHPQYITSPSYKNYTPAVAICLSDVIKVLKIISMHLTPSTFGKLGTSPSKLRNEEKKEIMRAIGYSLDECFVAAVSLPSIMVEAGQKNPTVTYNAIFNILLLPLIQMHKNFSVSQFHLKLPNYESNNSLILGGAKKVLKAIYSENGSHSVETYNYNNVWNKVNELARMIAWAVSAAHNSNNTKWLDEIEIGIQRVGSPHMGEPKLDVTPHVIST